MPWNILIVEDDAELRDALSEMLAAHGYRLRTASNGQEALAMLEQRAAKPAVIVLDMMMPVMDGQEFLRRAGADASLSTIPVIVLSAQPQETIAFPPSVTEVLPKPLDLRRLLDVVGRACGRRISIVSGIPSPIAARESSLPPPASPALAAEVPPELDSPRLEAAAAPAAEIVPMGDPPAES